MKKIFIAPQIKIAQTPRTNIICTSGPLQNKMTLFDDEDTDEQW